MQLIENMEIKVRGSSERITEKNESVFHKVDNVVFCKSCGKQYTESEMVNDFFCVSCGEAETSGFLRGEIASSLAGYIKLLNNGYLKNCYISRFKKSAARMNPKRMVIWLLIKDGLMLPGDRKTEAVVYKAMNAWK